MKRLAQLLWFATRTLASWVFSFALWTCWLALVILLAAQIYIATAREVAVPGFVLRGLEERLTTGGFRAKFGRTAFDLSGRVHADQVSLSMASFAEPVLTARSVFVRLDPWLLVAGLVEPREVRLSGVAVAVPAMLSPSGRAEEVLRDLDVTLEPERRAVVVRQFSGRLAGLTVTAHGRLAFGGLSATPAPGDNLAATIGKRFPEWCRQALALAEHIGRFEEPSLDLEFTPSESGATTIQLHALARGAQWPGPVPVAARDLAVATRLLLFGDAPPSDIDVSATELRFGNDAVARGVQARVLGRLRVDGAQFDLRELRLTADGVIAQGATANALSAQIFPRPLPAIEVTTVAKILGAPLAVQAEADVQARSAFARFRGELSPALLDLVSTRVGGDVRRFFDFDSLAIERGEARFAAGGKFDRLTARVAVPTVRAYGVTLTDGRVLAELEPGRFYAPEAFARVGENFATGTYEQEFGSNRFRFLLAGQLQPLAIAPWFRSGWWQSFFSQFEFQRPPEAAVDYTGVWRDGRQSRVFVFADTAPSVIRGAALDRVRTRLYIRAGLIDGLELLATRGTGAVTGQFTYTNDPATAEWRSVDLRFDSTLDLPTVSQLIGPTVTEIFRPFQLAQPPVAKVEARFAHAAAPGGAASQLRIDARSTGEFRFHGFPLQDVSFKANVDRDTLTLDDLNGTFAGGHVSGKARAWGAGAQRRLGFDLALSDASLGQVVSGVNGFFAAKKGEPPAPPGKFVQEKANVHVDLTASAEGGYDNAFSYQGTGNAVLRGAEIGEVPLLGSLSGLLKFTALRFTEVRGNFKIEGPRLVFPQFTLRGSNSAIDGHGHYALDRNELDFNAKIFPFHESDSIIKTVVGAVLTPLSNAFEVRLTGSLAKPEWAFANFSSSAPAAETAPPAEPKPAPAPSGNALPRTP